MSSSFTDINSKRAPTSLLPLLCTQVDAFFLSDSDLARADKVHLLFCYGSPCASRLPERRSGGGVEQQEQERGGSVGGALG